MDQIDAADQLRDTVLDLEPGIDLQEIGLAIGCDQELGRSRIPEADRPGDPNGKVVQSAPGIGGETGSWRLLQQLLVAALDGAVALPQGHDRALRVAKELDLDMSRALDVALEVHAGRTEGLQCLCRGTFHRDHQIIRVVHATHAAAPATRGRLDQDWIADVTGHPSYPSDRLWPADLDGCERARNDGHTLSPCCLACGDLVAKARECRRSRSDEGDALVLDRGRESRLLRQEPIAGMHGIGTGVPGRRDDRVRDQVALGRRRGSDASGEIGCPDMHRVPVRVAEHRHGLDAQLTASADDAQGDLAPVGDEQPTEWR